MSCIMIVDDDGLILQSTVALLESHGYATMTASNGQEAISLFRQSPCDLVLVDIFMPQHGGFETIMALRNSVPIIAMSGVAKSKEFEPLSFAMSIGAKAALKKPFLPEKLLDVINSVLFSDAQCRSDQNVEVVTARHVGS